MLLHQGSKLSAVLEELDRGTSNVVGLGTPGGRRVGLGVVLKILLLASLVEVGLPGLSLFVRSILLIESLIGLAGQ